MRSAGSDVILRRVTLKGRASSPQAARRGLLQALDDAPWPSTSSNQVIHLRRLRISGSPRDLPMALAKELRTMVDQAVDGWSDQADEAPAVRFRSRADRTACLIRDLLSGRHTQRWFWKTSNQEVFASPSVALAQALLEEPMALPSTLDRLAESGGEERFWCVLQVPDAIRILQAVGYATGWLDLIAVALGGPGEPVAEATLGLRLGAPLPAGLRAEDPRVVLAALGLLWRKLPGALKGNRGASLLAGVAAHLATPSTPAAHSDRRIAEDDGPKVAYVAESANDDDPTLVPLEASPKPVDACHEPRPCPQVPVTSAPILPVLPADSRGISALLWESGIELEPSPAPVSPKPRSEWEGCTGQGGIFFLLNALALEVYQHRLTGWEEPGGGWRMLARLALALGCRPDADLEEFLVREAALGVQGLDGLPPLAEPLVRMGTQRFGEGIWNAGLFSIPARILATSSHVDVHYRLEDARLEIRRVGLDVNPGWLPWLGRVVTFHFGSGLEPEQP